MRALRAMALAALLALTSVTAVFAGEDGGCDVPPTVEQQEQYGMWM